MRFKVKTITYWRLFQEDSEELDSDSSSEDSDDSDSSSEDSDDSEDKSSLIIGCNGAKAIWYWVYNGIRESYAIFQKHFVFSCLWPGEY